LAAPLLKPSVEIQRSESIKLKPKRTPSFTTRRRTQSFRRVDRNSLLDCYMERKQEQTVGGKRAAVRSWKTYYVVLTTNQISFYKDEDEYNNSNNKGIDIKNSIVEIAQDYTKKKNVWRFKTFDGAEFLFATENYDTMKLWVNTINDIKIKV